MTMMAGGAWAQAPNVIDNARSAVNSAQQQKNNDVNAALQESAVPAQKPAPGSPATRPTAPVVKAAAATAKPVVKPPATPAEKPAATSKSSAPVAKTAEAKSSAAKAPVSKTPATKAAPAKSVAPVKAQTAAKPVVAPAATTKPTAVKIAAPKTVIQPQVAKGKDGKPVITPMAKPAAAAADASKQPKPEEKKWAMSGKRDPFFSPVVQQTGSGCASGKKCLEIGQINVRGVVRSDNGFIAVVTNNLIKAYFLRENDPVFNGYVVKITGDSVVFQETVQDKLGKPFTREVVKRIFTPAV